MKISVVTAVFNRKETIRGAVDSFRRQTYKDVEHVVIDGASTDGTTSILYALGDGFSHLVSEPDGGIYEALNKGISLANGDVVGVLHADDIFASPGVLELIAGAFKSHPEILAAYGDLDYVSAKNPARIVRHWKAGPFRQHQLAYGWMPPHPTLFVRREVFQQWGAYDTSYRISADYDAILRWFSKEEFQAVYIPQVLVKMRMGGESNRSLSHIVRKSSEDYRALQANYVGGVGTLSLKNVRKMTQFILR